MEHTECYEMSTHKISDTGESPKRKNDNIHNTAKVWSQEKLKIDLLLKKKTKKKWWLQTSTVQFHRHVYSIAISFVFVIDRLTRESDYAVDLSKCYVLNLPTEIDKTTDVYPTRCATQD